MTIKNFKNSEALINNAKEAIKGFKKTEGTAPLLTAIRKHIADVERYMARKTPLNEAEMKLCSAAATQADYRASLLTKHTECVEFCESMGINTVDKLARNKYGKYVALHTYATTGKLVGKDVYQSCYMTRFIDYVMKDPETPVHKNNYDPINADMDFKISQVAARLGLPDWELNQFTSVAYNTQPAAVCNVIQEMGYGSFKKAGANGIITLFADSPLVQQFNKGSNA